MHLDPPSTAPRTDRTEGTPIAALDDGPASEDPSVAYAAGVYELRPERHHPLQAAQPPPSSEELTAAWEFLREHRLTSPCYRVPRLSGAGGREVSVKYEILSPIRSFKVRGAFWAVAQADRAGIREIVTASTGNHGQGIAYAGSALGVRTTIFVPEDVDEVKFASMAQLGAQIERAGTSLADAEQHAQAYAVRAEATYLEDGEDPRLMAGAASIGLEILEQLTQVDTIVVPVGGGNLAAAVALALEQADSPARLVAVQSTAAPGVAASLLGGRIQRLPSRTRAGGLATDRPGVLAFDVLRRRLDAICLVEEEWLWSGIRTAFDGVGIALELAAAAPFAALERFGDQLGGPQIVLLASGACIDARDLAFALSGGQRPPLTAPVPSPSPRE